jgi:hypothetical protein
MDFHGPRYESSRKGYYEVRDRHGHVTKYINKKRSIAVDRLHKAKLTTIPGYGSTMDYENDKNSYSPRVNKSQKSNTLSPIQKVYKDYYIKREISSHIKPELFSKSGRRKQKRLTKPIDKDVLKSIISNAHQQAIMSKVKPTSTLTNAKYELRKARFF